MCYVHVQMINASPLREQYFRAHSNRLLMEASYDIAHEPLAHILTDEHGMDEQEVSSSIQLVG